MIYHFNQLDIMAKEKKKTTGANNIKKKSNSKSSLFPNEYETKDNLTNSLAETPDNFMVDNVKDRKRSSDIFALNKPLYLQIAVENIYSIFSKALILPYIYLGEKLFPDVQSIHKNCLLISNGIIDPITNHLILEVELKKSEESLVQISGDIGVINFPLPLSRIKKIYVPSISVKNDIYKTALANDGGIIPDSIIDIFPKSLKKVKVPEFSTVNPESKIDSIKLYDKILGTFAFLGNYNLILTKRTNVFKNLPDHYLFALQALVKGVPSEIPSNERATNFYRQLFGVKSGETAIFSWLIDRLVSGDNFHDEDVTIFANVMAKNVISKTFLSEARQIFVSLNKTLERKTALKNIPTLNDTDKFYLYLFAILRQYGSTNSEDRSISRADLPEFIHLPYGEYTFACLGFFYGYSALRNYEEKPVVEDPVFYKFLNDDRRQTIKFKLEDKFDLNIIEMVYQFSFNKHTDCSFLECLPRKRTSQRVSSGLSTAEKEAGYSLSTIQVLDRLIYTVKRKTITEQIEEYLDRLGTDIPGVFTEIGILCYSKHLPWHFGDLNSLITNPNEFVKYLISFKKNDLVEAIKSGRIDQRDVLNTLKKGFDNNNL